MALPKLQFITQPASTTQGFTIVPTAATTRRKAGIQVGIYDSEGLLAESDTSTVTLALINSTGATAPVQTNPSTSTSGGTGLAATTQYFYVVTAIYAIGESLVSNEKSVTTGSGGTNSNTVNWNAATGATGYRIYRGTTSGGENVYYTVGAVTTYVDTGAAATSGTPPTTLPGLVGTVSKAAIGGIATFDDLSVSIAANGYALYATDAETLDGDSITAATSDTFNITAVYRINPSQVTGTPSGTGLSNAIGPYRFRGSRSIASVRVSFTSTNATDVAQVVFTEPGVALATNSAQIPKLANYSGSITAPASIVLDAADMGGNVDIYVYTTTQSGTPSVKIERVEPHMAP